MKGREGLFEGGASRKGSRGAGCTGGRVNGLEWWRPVVVVGGASVLGLGLSLSLSRRLWLRGVLLCVSRLLWRGRLSERLW